MIGVVANPADHDVVAEFFELFKTPWEFYRSGRKYDAVLCAAGDQFNVVRAAADVIIVYAGKKLLFEDERNVQIERSRGQFCMLSYLERQIPIYDNLVTFPGIENGVLTNDDTRHPAAYLDRDDGTVVARIGYDLFTEIRQLITVGQPAANAHIPTLELHIAFLRDLITQSGARLLEIPPIPDNYSFITCLTHDVDHPSIRQHKWDRTMVGFLYRAVFGSLINLLRRRIAVQTLLRNWIRALKLPLVYLGVAEDFWCGFHERYKELERGCGSTFFVIPFKDHPGVNSHRVVPSFRAVRYGAADIADTIRKLMSAGCEVGLHGIDAWCDTAKGRAEFEEIRRITGASTIGVRMHWLYYDQQSPVVLEKVGAAYDSTVGYNETVGYRAGTTQVYKLLNAVRLLELPLHVMDTALFYPAYLDCSYSQARELVARMVDDVVHFGGCLTINWHDRSLAPERFWDKAYRDLLHDLRNRGAWFATAEQAIAWFQRRRSVIFKTDCVGSDTVPASLSDDNSDHLPGLRLRVYNPQQSSRIAMSSSAAYVDMSLDKTETGIPCAATS